jgi:hypothetical protein
MTIKCIRVMSRRAPTGRRRFTEGFLRVLRSMGSRVGRCLVAKCFNGNNGDEEKPRKTSKCA